MPGALGWLETRIPEEMAVYPTIVRIAHAIIAEGLSERVITPGISSTNDVQWWYRQTSMRWLDGRQERLHLIPRPGPRVLEGGPTTQAR